MKKQLSFVLVLMLLCVTVGALAETTQGVAYGMYENEGEHPDSLIRVTLSCEDGVITDAAIDEKLIPVSVSGASGWAELDEANTALLGDDVIAYNNKQFPASFALDGVVFTGAADDTVGVAYSGEVNGTVVDLLSYICTDEGGAWYFAQEEAQLLNAAGEAVATLPIGTKASIEHGVGFWPSDITFPGNIAYIAAFITENGVDYALEDVVMGEDGTWGVADATSGATLAGTPNYLRIAQQAYANATAQ